LATDLSAAEIVHVPLAAEGFLAMIVSPNQTEQNGGGMLII